MTEHKWAFTCILVGMLISALIYYYYHHTSTNNKSQGEIPDSYVEESSEYVWTASEDKLISTTVEMEIPKDIVSSIPSVIDRLKAYQLPNGEYQLSGKGYINIYTGSRLDIYQEITNEPLTITISDNQILVGTTGLEIERIDNED